MKRIIQIIFASLVLLFISTGMAQATCTVSDPYYEHWCPSCSQQKFSGQAYGTGDCRAACKAWGTYGVSYYGGYYRTYWFQSFSSHPYWFPDQATSKCEVSDDPNKWQGSLCPTGVGTNECNY